MHTNTNIKRLRESRSKQGNITDQHKKNRRRTKQDVYNELINSIIDVQIEELENLTITSRHELQYLILK